MKGSEIFLALSVAALVVAGGAIWARRAQAAEGATPALVGFSWDPKLRKFTRRAADGTLEYYGGDQPYGWGFE